MLKLHFPFTEKRVRNQPVRFEFRASHFGIQQGQLGVHGASCRVELLARAGHAEFVGRESDKMPIFRCHPTTGLRIPSVMRYTSLSARERDTVT